MASIEAGAHDAAWVDARPNLDSTEGTSCERRCIKTLIGLGWLAKAIWGVVLNSVAQTLV